MLGFKLLAALAFPLLFAAACGGEEEELPGEESPLMTESTMTVVTPTLPLDLSCETWLGHPEINWPQEIRAYDTIILGEAIDTRGRRPI